MIFLKLIPVSFTVGYIKEAKIKADFHILRNSSVHIIIRSSVKSYGLSDHTWGISLSFLTSVNKSLNDFMPADIALFMKIYSLF